MSTCFKIAIITGGTGGHIFPALALAEALHNKKQYCLILADERFLHYKQQFPGYLPYKIVPSGNFVGSILRKFITLIKILFGILYSINIYLNFRPNLVIGFGSYVSVPSVLAAKILGIPIIIHEQNAVIGKANKFLMKFAKIITLTFNHTIGVELQKHKVEVVGNPVRREILKYRDLPYRTPDKVISILVTGGSQAAVVFSKVLPAAIVLLEKSIRERIKLFQQCRIEDSPKVRQKYSELGVDCIIEKFFNNMPELLSEAHIIISRAGASIISELIAIGRPAIFVPIHHSIGNHQYLNAKILKDNGAAWLINEPEFTAENCANLLSELIKNPDRLSSAASNARMLYNNSSDRLVDIIINFCRYGHI